MDAATTNLVVSPSAKKTVAPRPLPLGRGGGGGAPPPLAPAHIAKSTTRRLWWGWHDC